MILVLGWGGSGDVRKLRGGVVVIKGAEDTGLNDACCWAGEGPVQAGAGGEGLLRALFEQWALGAGFRCCFLLFESVRGGVGVDGFSEAGSAGHVSPVLRCKCGVGGMAGVWGCIGGVRTVARSRLLAGSLWGALPKGLPAADSQPMPPWSPHRAGIGG